MSDRAVLVTGASTGIGRACAARLGRSGWRVYAGVRREEDGERLLSERAGDIVPVHLDVTDRGSVDRAVVRVDDEMGALHGLVNNAGIAVSGPFELLDESEWREQFDVNFFGVIAMTRSAFPLLDRAGGRVVHIGSINGRVAPAGTGPYSASKHALEAFNWALRAELAAIGPMRSSIVEPGEIRTAIWDKGTHQLHEAEERVARAGLAERYDWMIDMYHGYLAEAFEQAIDPDRVAAAVEHALTADRPKARYLVGTDAKILAVLAKMPDRLRELVMAKASQRYQVRGRPLRSSVRNRIGASVD